MNFSEKLIQLRKKEGLSQEELSYKLNVTRQTISKWELGQTTPDMDKLSEISNFFGVSVDTLLNESEEISIDDKKIGSENNSNKNSKKVLIIILCVLLFLIIGAFILVKLILSPFKLFFNFAENTISSVEQQVENQISDDGSIGNYIQDGFSNFKNLIEEHSNNINDTNADLTDSLELYSGTKFGSIVKTVIDKIITNNKKYSDNLITVTYNDTTTSDPAELQKLKLNFEDFKKYEISYEYDDNKYIYQMDIINLD